MTLRKDYEASEPDTSERTMDDMAARKTTQATRTTKNTKNNSQNCKITSKISKKKEQKENIRESEVPKTKIKNTGGRPPRIKTKDLIAAAYDYMNTAPVPNITEFALQQGYERQYLYERAENEKNKGKPQLSDTIKKISQMKEVQLEKLALMGLCPDRFAIFALKQLGWSDKVEQKIDADVDAEVSGVVMLAPVLEKNHEPES